MADLAERIRQALDGDPNVGEIKMFGGYCFTLNGNMLVGQMKGGGLLARVGDQLEEEALLRPGASRMNFTGREMRGFIEVEAEALDDEALRGWIALATAYVGTLPPKVKSEKKPVSKRN